MARSPFSGSFQPNSRPTVVTAPDAIVYLNGEQDIIGCGSCKRKFDFSKFITQIQVDLSVDSVPGSASVTMSIPRHVVDDFYFDGVPLISPMMEIEIFAKGYYFLEGIPQYYPIFWGLVTEVSDNYSSGAHTITVQCADILKWWEICRMNINPSFTAPAGQAGRNIFGNVFFGTNPYDAIFTLAQMSFGDVIVGTGSLVSLVKENSQRQTFNTVLGDIMQYWAGRFTRMRSNLLLYGVNGVSVRGDSLAQLFETGKSSKGVPFGVGSVRNAVRTANGGDAASQFVFDPTDEGITAFRTQGGQAGQINLWQSEYQTKLELANTCKEAIGFEFYMDVTGDIVFKPPFYNLDILSNKPLSWIQDIDIIDWNFSDSESEVITQMSIQGNFTGNIDWGLSEEATPMTSVTDYHLLRKYGWRPHSYNSEWMSDPTIMFYHGLDVMDRINSRRHQATINIPLRPELRLGFPVYLAPKDQIWYLKGISHNIAFGGRATTSLQLTARRGKFVAPTGTATLKMTGDLSDRSFRNAQAQYEKLVASGKKGSPPKPTVKSGTPAGPPTVKQLRDKAFTLDLGDVASIPAVNVKADDPKSLDPYQPLVLRHPKTGRIMGYPNAVMVYTRPFDEKLTKKAFDGIVAGQAQPGKQAVIPKASKAKTEAIANDHRNREVKSTTDEAVAGLTGSYGQNRFQYGITSAGAFVYAHDVSKVITQFALLPRTNITATKGDQDLSGKDSPLSGSGSAMLRPVSDERGFEVVGHFRYGRGSSLRDGALILNEKTKTNEVATPGVQLALSGNLFATLTAQSQGLTSIISAYANPADAIARLQPEDLQTSAVMVPGGTDGQKKPQFTESTFMTTATKDSPEAKGFDASLEAGQLSHALTLAEMSVKEETIPANENCDCQIGRADLAFINIGYQVKTINPASPETQLYDVTEVALKTAQKNAAKFEAQAKAAEDEWLALADQIIALKKTLADATRAGKEGEIKAISAQIAQLQAQHLKKMKESEAAHAQADQENKDAADMAANHNSVGQPQPAGLKFANIRSRVEDFLFDLYSALDDDHQPFESALRGDPSGQSTDVRQLPNLFTGSGADPSFGAFAPPFNPGARSGLGDPVATALTGSSAASDLKKTTEAFGDKLKKQSKKAGLTQDVANLNATIARLQKRLQATQNANGPGHATYGSTDTPEDLKKQISDAQHDLAQKQAELGQLG